MAGENFTGTVKISPRFGRVLQIILVSTSVSTTTKVDEMYRHTGAGEFCRAAK
uniref:Uncharacterized protein n=1 Tax=Arundo donax TaxID=35708 RepID=A0A0A9D2A9_ARUDO